MTALINSIRPRSLKKDFFSVGYLLSAFATLFIFFLGFKWTLLGIYWLPFIYNPFIYVCIILFWFYYNFMWLRTALCLPSAMLLIKRTYKAAGADISAWRVFYLALCKVNKLRAQDNKLRRSGNLIRMMSRCFMRHGIILNFRRDYAEELSVALFIHKKRQVFAMYKAIASYLVPSFIAILFLTPTMFFLSSFNYRYFIDKFSPDMMFATFGMYIVILPFGLGWLFLMLNMLGVNLMAPLVHLPCADLYGEYLKEKKIPVDFTKPQRIHAEGLVAVVMLGASMSFYLSTLLAKYAPTVEIITQTLVLP